MKKLKEIRNCLNTLFNEKRDINNYDKDKYLDETKIWLLLML
jgi:hypothetical protein